MKSKFLSVIILLGLLLLFAGTGIGQEKISTNDWVEKFNQGSINWTAGYIEAVGIGAPAEKSISKASSRPLALREAKRNALRNLLEITKGVQVNSTTTVKDFAVERNIINTQVNGLVQGAVEADRQYMPDGTAEVKLRMPLYGNLTQMIMPLSAPEPPPAPAAPAPPPVPVAPASAVTAPTAPASFAATPSSASAPPVPPASPAPSTAEAAAPVPPAAALAAPTAPVIYTGMVVDARGIQARPAMSFRIFDEDGKEVYGLANVDRGFAVQQGMSGYTRDLTAAQSNQRVTANPVTVKALKTSGPGKSDLVIGNADAQRVRAAAENATFMKQCRVMIVLD